MLKQVKVFDKNKKTYTSTNDKGEKRVDLRCLKYRVDEAVKRLSETQVY